MPELKEFYLVGDTALSLLYGHRISVDLDLFSNSKFENNIIVEALTKKFKSDFLIEQKPPQFGIFCFINDVKIDLVRHPFEMLNPPSVIQNIRMFSKEDIIAMKVQAILGRGKKKDFWDISELLNHFSIENFIEFHTNKYSSQNLLISVPQALTYFSDADESENPVSLKGQTWESVKADIQKKVREYLQG
jgi:hypothetical protein